MSRPSFPEIPQEALKSHAQPERVERVWRRLELDLDLAGAPRAAGSVKWWMSAAALGIFAAGVAFGARLHAPNVDMAARAEPPAAVPMPGAGPAVDPAASAPQRQDAPRPKHAHARRSLPSGAVPSEEADSYGEPAPTVLPTPTPVGAPPEWESLAEAGDFRGAKAALDRHGGFERASGRATASQLLVLADIARASGNREQAAQALKRVLSAYDSAPESPLAAWTLGNLLEQAGDASGAAEAYTTYRRLSPTGDFAEDAAARQVDAALSQGNLELGTRAMEEYAQNFPKGRRLAELRQRLNALAAPPDAAAGSVAPPSETDDDDDDGAEPAAEVPATPPAAAREH
jgi:tetratricopeptide (TPR) repeat protein